jgi:NitT/TauT family transport system permease protein
VSAVTPAPSRADDDLAPRQSTSLASRLVSAETALKAFLLVAIIAFWQFASMYLVGPAWISSPALVLGRIGTTLANGSLVKNTLVTLEEAIVGLVLGTAAGLVIGIVLSRVPRLISRAIDPYILGIYSLPRIALAPFFILWFGIGLPSKVALVVSVAGFVVLFNIRQGIDTVDSDLVDALRSMHASRWQMTRYVTVPSVLTWLIAAVKICVGICIVSAVVGELVGSTEGLGWYMTQTLNQFDMTGAVVALLDMALLAMLLYWIVAAIERRILPWQQEAGAAKTVTM